MVGSVSKTSIMGTVRIFVCGQPGMIGTSIRDEKLETIVIDAMAERLLRPERLQ